jgi:hypothetical protein
MVMKNNIRTPKFILKYAWETGKLAEENLKNRPE